MKYFDAVIMTIVLIRVNGPGPNLILNCDGEKHFFSVILSNGSEFANARRETLSYPTYC